MSLDLDKTNHSNSYFFIVMKNDPFKPFPHEAELSMFTNNHNQRVAATVACSQSLSYIFWNCPQNKKKKKKNQIPLKFSSRRVVLFHICASVEVSVLCYAAAWLLPEVCKTRAQYGTRVSAVQLFEPLLLSMMQLFHFVALFSRLTFVLLSVADDWLGEFNSLFLLPGVWTTHSIFLLLLVLYANGNGLANLSLIYYVAVSWFRGWVSWRTRLS